MFSVKSGTNYGCPKQLLIVEKYRYNFSCGLHLYMKQNGTFLITNISNVNTKSFLRNQRCLCIHLLVLYVPSLTRCFWGSMFPLITDNWLRKAGGGGRQKIQIISGGTIIWKWRVSCWCWVNILQNHCNFYSEIFECQRCWQMPFHP